jgi:hypothetical protein
VEFHGECGGHKIEKATMIVAICEAGQIYDKEGEY